MHYVGIDLNKRYVSVCALDKGGKVVSERRRLSNTAEAILKWLGELERPVAVALEAIHGLRFSRGTFCGAAASLIERAH